MDINCRKHGIKLKSNKFPYKNVIAQVGVRQERTGQIMAISRSLVELISFPQSQQLFFGTEFPLSTLFKYDLFTTFISNTILCIKL